MLLTIARFFMYLALVAPIFVNRTFFFPFITGKQIFFRISVEAALACFLIYLAAVFFDSRSTNAKQVWAAVKKHLRNPIVICLSIFAIALVIASLTSPTPGIAFWSNYERGDGAFQVLHYVLFAILIKLLFTNEKQMQRLLTSHLVVSIIVSAYAFGQMFAPQDKPSFFVAASDRVSGTLGNPSYLSAYLIFSLAIIVYFLTKTKDTLARTSLCILGALQIFLMIKAQTLGAAVGVFIGLIVFAVHLYLTTEHKQVRKVGLIVGGIVMGFFLLFLTTKHTAFWQEIDLFNRITDFSSAFENIKPRIWAWQSAMQAATDRPITGWGLENFAIPFDIHYNPYHYGHESFFDRTHDIFLEYLVGGGILAFVPWLLIFFFYYRLLQKRPSSIWKSAATAVPIMYLVQGIFLFDVLPIYLGFLVFLMFIVNTNPPAEDHPHLPEPNGIASAMSYAVGGLIILMIGFVMFMTAYRPLQRNLMIVRALNMGATLTQQLGKVSADKLTVSPEQAMGAFADSIDYPTPIGKGEAIEMYAKFVPELLGVIAKIPDIQTNVAARKDVLAVMTGLNAIVDANNGSVPGVKDRFSNASLNIRAGVIFNLPELVTRGKTMLENDLKEAPQRIELVAVLIELAQATKDTELLKRWGPVAVQLRPDLFGQTATTTSK